MFFPRKSARHPRRFVPQSDRLESRQLLTVAFDATSRIVKSDTGSAVVTLVNHPTGNATSPTAAQVNLAVTPISAQPGVDYQPVTQTIQFAAGETSKSVAIPLIKNDSARGTRTFKVTLAPTTDNPYGAATLVAVSHSPDVTPPRVLSSRALSRGSKVQAFVVSFTEDMEPSQVANPANYTVVDPRQMKAARGSQWMVPKSKIAIKSATYDPTTRSVLLTAAKAVRKNAVFMIYSRQLADAIDAITRSKSPNPDVLSATSPITDLAGNPLDSTGEGTPDGAFLTYAAATPSGQKLAAKLNASLSGSGQS